MKLIQKAYKSIVVILNQKKCIIFKQANRLSNTNFDILDWFKTSIKKFIFIKSSLNCKRYLIAYNLYIRNFSSQVVATMAGKMVREDRSSTHHHKLSGLFSMNLKSETSFFLLYPNYFIYFSMNKLIFRKAKFVRL